MKMLKLINKFVTNVINLKILVILIIPAGAILLWLIAFPSFSRFTTFSNFLTSLGQILGLIGYSLFALTLFFNTRLPVLEDLFGGLNKVFPIHHLLGKITFIFLLFHPTTLAARFITYSIQDTINFFIPSSYQAVNFGIFALAVLIILLFITFFVHLPYNKWISSHRFLGLAFILATIHVFLIDSDVAFNKPLRFYMLVVATIGIASYSYRSLFPHFFVKRYKYLVDQVKLLNNEVVELVFAPQKEKLTFLPGQFTFLEFSNFLPFEQHPFSITSSPQENKLTFAVKMLGDFTMQLKHLPTKTLTYLEGPYGRFGRTKYPEKDQIWVAGGIGITPYLSMAKSLDKNMRKVDLFYSVNDKKEAVYLKELTALSKNNANFRLFLHPTSLKGKINAELIAKTSGINSKEIFLCGPIPMINSLKKQFLQVGIKSEYIHSEEFQLYHSS